MKKLHTNKNKKLSLETQALRQLDRKELVHAKGGAVGSAGCSVECDLGPY